MKTTRLYTLFALLLVVTGMTTLTSCKKLPEQVTIRGQVTHEDGRPFEGVCIGVWNVAPFSGYGIACSNYYTDENGLYEVQFEPHRLSIPYTIQFGKTEDDIEYSYSCEVDIWKPVQELNVVLMKKEE